MLWKKGNERFALLIVAVVAVFGLILMFNNSWNDDDSFTGFAAKKFAAKKAVAKAKVPAPEVKTCVDSDGGRVLEVRGTVSGEYVNGRAYSFTDRCVRVGAGWGITEYTCKSPSAMGAGTTACPRGSACQNGACVSLCGNGRADRGENCGTCPADVQCGADERCENNACVSRFFCRGIVGGIETDQGVSQNVCDPATSVATAYSCFAANLANQPATQSCVRGCNPTTQSCCLPADGRENPMVLQSRCIGDWIETATVASRAAILQGCSAETVWYRINDSFNCAARGLSCYAGNCVANFPPIGERCGPGMLCGVAGSGICISSYRPIRSVPNAESGADVWICVSPNLTEGETCDIHRQCQQGLFCDNQSDGTYRPGQR